VNASDQSTYHRVESLLELARSGDSSARDRLIDAAWSKLLCLTRQIIQDFPNVRRWEQTDDVMQRSSLKLWKALEGAELSDARHFFRLSAQTIRHVLIDLARHYYGPAGQGRHHSTMLGPGRREGDDDIVEERGRDEGDPAKEFLKTEVHEVIDKLDGVDREIFDLLYYHDLTQAEAAELLGSSVRTVKRRWREARLQLAQKLSE
jgi:RNA polymerase sigma factor (sigma-70 family)